MSSKATHLIGVWTCLCRLVVRTLRCGRRNLGSNPSMDKLFISPLFFIIHSEFINIKSRRSQFIERPHFFFWMTWNYKSNEVQSKNVPYKARLMNIVFKTYLIQIILTFQRCWQFWKLNHYKKGDKRCFKLFNFHIHCIQSL